MVSDHFPSKKASDVTGFHLVILKVAKIVHSNMAWLPDTNCVDIHDRIVI